MMNRLIGTLRPFEYLCMVRTLEREINQYSIEIFERMNKLRLNRLLCSVGKPQAHPDEKTLCQEIAQLREARFLLLQQLDRLYSTHALPQELRNRTDVSHLWLIASRRTYASMDEIIALCSDFLLARRAFLNKRSADRYANCRYLLLSRRTAHCNNEEGG